MPAERDRFRNKIICVAELVRDPPVGKPVPTNAA
jgi:hypothetical protein